MVVIFPCSSVLFSLIVDFFVIVAVRTLAMAGGKGRWRMETLDCFLSLTLRYVDEGRGVGGGGRETRAIGVKRAKT